ncbi:hypothetical protein C0J52_20881 [Blattella germanica]|nr:hypothetical protein C0J52_20881 [Blattella germanica]
MPKYINYTSGTSTVMNLIKVQIVIKIQVVPPIRALPCSNGKAKYRLFSKYIEREFRKGKHVGHEY